MKHSYLYVILIAGVGMFAYPWLIAVLLVALTIELLTIDKEQE